MIKKNKKERPNLPVSELNAIYVAFEDLCKKIEDECVLISYDLFKTKANNLVGVGPSTIKDKLEENEIKIYNFQKFKWETVKEDFAGFYVFYKDGNPEYCGISRNVLKRLSDHTKGNKQSATFAHRLFMNNVTKNNKKALVDYKQEVLTYQFKLIKFYEPCPDTLNRYTVSTEHKEEISLYMFEVYASVYFNTKHNSFRTH